MTTTLVEPLAPATSATSWATVFVCVPRAVMAVWSPRPWAEVVAAAEQGVDGLSICERAPRVWRGLEGEEPPPEPDVAFLREGDGRRTGVTLLYQQNW